MSSGLPDRNALMDELLSKTSRTFALAIPMLPEPTRREVSIAYLLLRVADTLEDGVLWAPALRVEELRRYSTFLRAPSRDPMNVQWLTVGLLSWLCIPPPVPKTQFRWIVQPVTVGLPPLRNSPPP